MELTHTGQLANLGVVVDTSGGGGHSDTFDLAVNAAGEIFYTSPQIDSDTDPGTVIKPGTVEKFGSGPVWSGNGDPSDFDDPIGLAFDSAGNLYFGLLGNGASGFQVSLMELTHTGQLANLGVVVDTSGGVGTPTPSILRFSMATVPLAK